MPHMHTQCRQHYQTVHQHISGLNIHSLRTPIFHLLHSLLSLCQAVHRWLEHVCLRSGRTGLRPGRAAADTWFTRLGRHHGRWVWGCCAPRAVAVYVYLLKGQRATVVCVCCVCVVCFGLACLLSTTSHHTSHTTPQHITSHCAVSQLFT